MSLSAEARARLAKEQAALAAALTARGEPPAGFDEGRLRASVDALARKRARAVARAWTEMAQSLGARFFTLFGEYAGESPMPRQGGALADGRRFARWLATRGELPDSGRLQALAVDLRYAASPEGLSPRKWPRCKAVWLRETRRLVIGVRAWWFGEFWWG
jgi:hypothetical protein